MAKGDDAEAQHLRNGENAVSARVAAIMASKRGRKSGKRRICEGMCFSLPTPDDPFNDRHGTKPKNDEPTEETAPAEDDPKKDDTNNTKKQPPARTAAPSTTTVPGAWGSGSAARWHRLRTRSTLAASTPPGSRRHGSSPPPAASSPGRRSSGWSLAPSYCTSSPPRKRPC